MDPELQALVKLPVVLVSRKELYSIVSVLGLTIVGCGCVLGYSFANYGELDHGADKLRIYIASGDRLVEKRAAEAGRAVHVRSATVKHSGASSAGSEPSRVDLQAADTRNVSVSVTGGVGAARRETGGRRPDMGRSEGRVRSAVGPAVRNGAPIVYSIVTTNGSHAVRESGFAKTP